MLGDRSMSPHQPHSRLSTPELPETSLFRLGIPQYSEQLLDRGLESLVLLSRLNDEELIIKTEGIPFLPGRIAQTFSCAIIHAPSIEMRTSFQDSSIFQGDFAPTVATSAHRWLLAWRGHRARLLRGVLVLREASLLSVQDSVWHPSRKDCTGKKCCVSFIRFRCSGIGKRVLAIRSCR